MHDLEWRSRRNNLELHVIPMSINEELILIINEGSKELDMPDLTSGEITAVHRLSSRADKIPGNTVRFACQTTLDTRLDRRSRLRNIELKPIFWKTWSRKIKPCCGMRSNGQKRRNSSMFGTNTTKGLVSEKDDAQTHLIKPKYDFKTLSIFILVSLIFIYFYVCFAATQKSYLLPNEVLQLSKDQPKVHLSFFVRMINQFEISLMNLASF